MGLADALIPGVASNASNLVARKQLKFVEFKSSGNFVIGTGGDATTSATLFNILLVGAGGGGGLGSVTTSSGAAGSVVAALGGAGGGGEVKVITTTGIRLLGTATSGTISVTIGAGGVGGASSNGGTAAVGGDSKFGDIVARGGGCAPSVTISAGAGGVFVDGISRATTGGTAGVETSLAASGAGIAGGGAGGGRPFSEWMSATQPVSGHYKNGVAMGKNGGSGASTTISPDWWQTPTSIDVDSASIARAPLCGQGANAAPQLGTAGGFWGRGGEGLYGFGGGASGGLATWGGTTIALAVVTPSTWDIKASGTAYNQPEYYAIDGGGRGAVITGAATANWIQATSGSANTGGGGGGGGAVGTAATNYNTYSAAGSGASGYCVVYWWE